MARSVGAQETANDLTQEVLHPRPIGASGDSGATRLPEGVARRDRGQCRQESVPRAGAIPADLLRAPTPRSGTKAPRRRPVRRRMRGPRNRAGSWPRRSEADPGGVPGWPVVLRDLEEWSYEEIARFARAPGRNGEVADRPRAGTAAGDPVADGSRGRGIVVSRGTNHRRVRWSFCRACTTGSCPPLNARTSSRTARTARSAGVPRRSSKRLSLPIGRPARPRRRRTWRPASCAAWSASRARRRRPFGVFFGIDLKWAGAFTAAIVAVLIGHAVASRRQPPAHLRVTFATPPPAPAAAQAPAPLEARPAAPGPPARAREEKTERRTTRPSSPPEPPPMRLARPRPSRRRPRRRPWMRPAPAPGQGRPRYAGDAAEGLRAARLAAARALRGALRGHRLGTGAGAARPHGDGARRGRTRSGHGQRRRALAHGAGPRRLRPRRRRDRRPDRSLPRRARKEGLRGLVPAPRRRRAAARSSDSRRPPGPGAFLSGSSDADRGPRSYPASATRRPRASRAARS